MSVAGDLIAFATALAGLLGALGAVFGVTLSATRTARLRRREQLFRENLLSLPEREPQRLIIAELHRAVMAEIVARQMTSPWRVIWPWVVCLAVIAISAQTGFNLAGYIATAETWHADTLVEGAFGDPVTGWLVIPTMLWLFPFMFHSFMHTVVGRATVAMDYYEGRQISRPQSFQERASQAEFDAIQARERGRKARRSSTGEAAADTPATTVPLGTRVSVRPRRWASSVGSFLQSMVPGLFASSLGVNIGFVVWLREQDNYERALGALGPAYLFGVVAFSVLTIAMIYVATWIVLDFRDLRLPQTHPRSGVVLVSQFRKRTQRR